MRRLPLAIAAVSLLGSALVPSAASATEVQIGQTATAVAPPTCPSGSSASSCTILLTKMTGLQTVSDGTAAPTKVTQPGVLSSFTVGVSSAAKSYVTTLDSTYGGPPEAQITVLRRVGNGAGERWSVAAEGPVENLTGYQGDTVEFPLGQELPVVPGEVLALTVPTWAPVLSIDLSTNFSYAQSRTGNCTNSASSPAYTNPQLNLGDITGYGCSYAKTRVEYEATEITTPTASVAQRKAARPRRVGAPRILKRG